MTKSEAIAKLRKIIDEIPNLYNCDWQSPKLEKWKREAHIALKFIFNDSGHLQDFNKIKFLPPISKPTDSKSWIMSAAKQQMTHDLNLAKAILESMIDEINDYWEEENSSSVPNQNDSDRLWNLLHPSIGKVSRTLFDSYHFADSVLAAMKEVNFVLKEKVRSLIGLELDGAKLMQKTFSTDKPILLLGDVDTQTGKDLQLGFQQIFSGAIIGIRNPKAHENLIIDENRAIHFLFLASLLMHKIDEAKQPKIQVQNPQSKNKSVTLKSVPSSNNKEIQPKPGVNISFQNREPYIENIYYSGDGLIDIAVRIMVTNESDNILGLETFLVLDTKPLEDIPLLPKGEPHSTFNLHQGGRKLINIAEFRAASKLIRFSALPSYLDKSAITLENNEKITFTIKVMGNMQPCSKRFAFYSNERGLQVEEI